MCDGMVNVLGLLVRVKDQDDGACATKGASPRQTARSHCDEEEKAGVDRRCKSRLVQVWARQLEIYLCHATRYQRATMGSLKVRTTMIRIDTCRSLLKINETATLGKLNRCIAQDRYDRRPGS